MSDAPTPARLCAYRVLRRVTDDGAYADRALRAEAGHERLEGRERALARRLSYEAIQRRALLDHVIDAVSDRPVEEIDHPLLDALRLGVLQLLYFRVPDHAAVDETVELVKHEGGHAGFANAVMRRAAREKDEIVEAIAPDGKPATPEAAALLHSHPRWLAEMWWEMLGADEALALLEHDNSAPEVAVRANELVTTRDELAEALGDAGVEAEPAVIGADPGIELLEGLVLEPGSDPGATDLFESGALVPQSGGSMLVGRVVAPEPGQTVLDMCAAPGAKATHLAALMRDEGELHAIELHPGRAAELEQACSRARAGIVRVMRADATRDISVPECDRVLVDAPCSDLGVLQSRPDARWRKTPDSIHMVAGVQGALLVQAAGNVAPGGTLVYSTCTISPRENEQQIAEFLDEHPGFEADDLGWEWPAVRSPADERCLQLLPHRDGTSGFFIARLRRTR